MICFENFNSITKESRAIMASWLRIAEAENAGHDVAPRIRAHAEMINSIGGDNDSEKVLRRLRVSNSNRGRA